MRLYFAEMLGTFFLMFAGTGAMIVNDIVMTIIYAIGDFSGAHINSAVNLDFWAVHCFPSRRVLPYIGSQCLGAVAASLVMSLLFLENPGLG